MTRRDFALFGLILTALTALFPRDLVERLLGEWRLDPKLMRGALRDFDAALKARYLDCAAEEFYGPGPYAMIRREAALTGTGIMRVASVDHERGIVTLGEPERDERGRRRWWERTPGPNRTTRRKLLRSLAGA